MANPSNIIATTLLAYAAQRDLNIERLAGLSGIDLSNFSSADAKILDNRHIGNLWQHAITLSNDPLLGLHYGESLQLVALGSVGHIIKTSATVGEALTLAASLTPTITDMVEITVNRKNGSIEVDLISKKTGNEAELYTYQTIDLLMVLIVHELDGLMFRKIKPNMVLYAGSLINSTEYERILRAPVQKHKQLNRLIFDDSFWQEPIITANYELQQIFIEKTESLREAINVSSNITAKVRKYLLSNSYLGIISLEELSQNFNMSSRTLQRKLKAEDSSYQVIADEVRKLLAVEYLKNNNTSIKEISFSLGYNELSAFTRSFKRWTGLAPNTYRQALI